MKKPEITRDLARRTGITEAEAADRLDRVVQDILTKLRAGRTASLPGLGRFSTSACGKVKFEPQGEKRRG